MKMAQPNVAREPSMEEILASIRRIIESNEPPADNALGHSLQPVYDDEDIGTEEIDIVTEMAANDPGEPRRAEPVAPFVAPAIAPAAERDMPAERSLSLADVAARVREASARQIDNGTVRLSQSVAAPSSEIGSARPAETPRQQPALAELRPSHPVAPAEAVSSLPAKVAAAAALLSDDAGAQVARSFGELADVFDGVEKPSLEDMAQDMLRPMLQEWLDDNLPTLVERLVREEIERVARGPRR